MRYNEENIKKLASGEVALKVDRDNLELTAKVVDEAFPNDATDALKYLNHEVEVCCIIHHSNGVWEDLHTPIDLPTLPLSDFVTQEENNPNKTNTSLITKFLERKQPKTAQERDELVKQLQAMDFKKELPSKLEPYNQIFPMETTLIKLLRMRDVYRDGWVSDTENLKHNWCIEMYKGKLDVDSYEWHSTIFSFPTEELANQFLNNFREDLESVKHLIS